MELPTPELAKGLARAGPASCPPAAGHQSRGIGGRTGSWGCKQLMIHRS